MTSETELDDLHRLREQVDLEAAGPAEPDHLVQAGRRLTEIRDRLQATDDPLERYELEREATSITQAIVPDVREFERRRRESQRAADAGRRSLQQAARRLYDERRGEVTGRLEELLSEAAREIADLESFRAELESGFELRGISSFRNSHLARLIADAERVRGQLADDEDR